MERLIYRASIKGMVRVIQVPRNGHCDRFENRFDLKKEN